MEKFVIEAPGKPPRILSARTEHFPVAICMAESSDQAISKYWDLHPEIEDVKAFTISPIESWGFTGDYIETEAENEPICSICIEEDGGFMGEEVELPAGKRGPCWRCREILEQSIDEYIE
jgi:hypothetical protein